MAIDVFLPLLTYPDACSTHGVDEALALARDFSTAVHVLVIDVDIPDLRNRLGSTILDVAGMAAAAEAHSHAAGVKLRDHIKPVMNGLTVTTSTIKVGLDQIGEAASRRARTHDLAMVLLDSESSEKRGLVEALVFGAGRPVMVVPERFTRHSIGHVAIAWDGSRPASRAVHDAMPFLSETKGVTVITAFDDKAIGAEAVADLVAYLERHGITPLHHDISVAGKSIGPALQQAALSRGAGLLVMGAFGHSRLRDFILGGATRTTLDKLTLPVLFSH